MAGGQSSDKKPGKTLARLWLGQIGESACSDESTIRITSHLCRVQSVLAAHCFQNRGFCALDAFYI